MDFFSLMLAPFSHWGILFGGTMIFFILGWLWYNPITPIGKIWIKYFPIPAKDHMPKGRQIAMMVLLQLFMGWILAHTVMILWLLLGQLGRFCTGPIDCYTSMINIGHMETTLLIVKIYMGFVFIKDLGHWYFEGKPFPLILISVGYYLVGILGVCGLLSWFL